MKGKVLLLLAGVQLVCVTANPGALVPTFSGSGNGRVFVNWLGVKGSITLGQAMNTNSTDGTVMFQMKFPHGRKCMMLLDGGMSRAQGVAGHIMVGAQLKLGVGITAGIGGNVGRRRLRFGVNLTPQIFKRIRYYQLGRYSDILNEHSRHFLETY